VSFVRAGKSFLRDLVLPRPAAGMPRLPEGAPLVVAGMFRTGSGIGRAAVSCLEALQREGVRPVAVDLSARFNQADLEPHLPLAPFPGGAQGTLILVANPPEVPVALKALGLRRWHNWRVIASWVWELPVAPEAWRPAGKFVSEIWVPSRFVADAFAGRFDRPVKVVPHFTALPALSPASDNETLRILTLADARSSLERKNPLASVRMFKAAFGDAPQAELTIKCRNLDLYPDYGGELLQSIGGDPRIHLIRETLQAHAQAELVQACDVLLSPHRAEGFGVPLAEAMALGKYVIATGWSGNLDFMDAGCAVLLPSKLIPAVDRTGVYAPIPGAVWAEPDFDAGVEALRAAASTPERRYAFRAAGPAAVAARLGSRAYLEAMKN
jgi:glycosyltransferase involved in cell wall biosynthesis